MEQTVMTPFERRRAGEVCLNSGQNTFLADEQIKNVNRFLIRTDVLMRIVIFNMTPDPFV